MKCLLLYLSVFLLLHFQAGCREEERSDAYGNFEAVETTVATQASGALVRFAVDEGDTLTEGARVGLVDTVQLALAREQLVAQRAAVRKRPTLTAAQIAVLQEQRAVAARELERFRALFEDQAATRKQVDDLEGQIRILDRQIQQAATQDDTVPEEVAQIDARIAQLDDQLRRSYIQNPVAGTVLATYVEPHEVVSPGQPLYRIAALDTLVLRAYVTGAQLPEVRLGQAVDVLVDDGGGTLRAVPGRITWIASEAEFTPTPIQTRDERAELVYAVKIDVANPDGRLKIGMPGEVRWNENPEP